MSPKPSSSSPLSIDWQPDMLYPQRTAGGWRVHDVRGDAVIAIAASRPALDCELEHKVNSIWTATKARNPALFNGEVFNADFVSMDEIRGHWTEYRRIVAQAADPALATALRIRPLAVAGLIEGPDGIIFGQRSSAAVYQPGLWQLAPAGNVDPSAARDGAIDLAAALATELREELGLTTSCVSEPQAICAVQHPGVDILDICLAMQTTLDAATIMRSHTTGSDGEYPRIAVVPRRELPAFLAGRDGPVAPQTRLFLARYDSLGAAAPRPADDTTA